MVEPPRTHSKLPCRSAYPCITVVRGGSVWSNHPKLTRNCPVGLLPPASQWFEEVRCGRTTPNSLDTALWAFFPLWFEEVRCGRTTQNSLETALEAYFPMHQSGSLRFGVVEPPRTLPCRHASLHHSGSRRFGVVEPPQTH